MGQSADLDNDHTIIQMWLTGSSTRTIATALGWSTIKVSSRIQYLRGRGVRIPPRQQRGLDVARLNALIEGGPARKRK